MLMCKKFVTLRPSFDLLSFESEPEGSSLRVEDMANKAGKNLKNSNLK